MKNEKTPGSNGSGGGGYKRFALKRIVAGVLITALVIWMASLIFGFFDKTPHATSSGGGHAEDVKTADHSTDSDLPARADGRHADPAAAHTGSGDDNVDRYKKLFERRVASQDVQMADDHGEKANPPAEHGASRAPAAEDSRGHAPAEPQHGSTMAAHSPAPAQHAKTQDAPQHAAAEDSHAQPAPAAKHQDAPAVGGHDQGKQDAHATAAAPQAPQPHQAPAAADSHGQAPAAEPHGTPDHAAAPAPEAVQKARGVAFVEAVIRPMNDELNERLWGWRPNDLVNVTDNVNTFQLGVLEVTRRTTIVLTERISRIGSTASFDDNLEQAMNWFMIKPSRYWLPSPEDKYNEGLDNLRQYAQGLEKGTARFYTRTDNLIPLLAVYQDLLGSCDENLAKAKEENGEEVSSFKADDYFFYAQGVASAMMGILEAIHHEFHSVLETRKARDALHHAIESLHHATAIDPWIILNSDLSSIFANHRANMAAPISHARFYLGVAIGALST